MLGLFDRPADEKALRALLIPPAIPGFTESLTDLRASEWRTILARLRRARLVAGDDPHNPGHLDAHPLVREYFGEQLRRQQTNAWKESNRRLYHYYRTLAPHLPNSFRQMEPPFSAVICGCNAGLVIESDCETLDVFGPSVQFLVAPQGSDEAPCFIKGTISPGGSVPIHSHQAITRN